MRIVSVNVGLPREVTWRGETILTGIFKKPVAGRVRVERLNLVGDRQADLTVHGGADKAVYVYPSEHYAFWREELPGVDLPWGSFGENITSEGIVESDVFVGDQFNAGSTELIVTQPRMPCFKLGIRFGRPDIIKPFLKSGRTGFYVSVSREGDICAGDEIVMNAQNSEVSVSDIVSLYAGNADHDLLRRASELSALPEAWRDHFRERLQSGKMR